MWKLAFLAIAVLSMFLSVRGSASAKGGDFTIIIGGGELAPYYYAVPGPLPLDGQWLGLLPGYDVEPSGRVADPADARALLAASYDLYFDELPEQGSPHASYVPGTASHPAYLYWRAARGGMPDTAWFTLTDVARVYLDQAVDSAVAMKRVGGVRLETDWLASAVLHGRCCMRPDGSPEFVSDSYVVTENIQRTSFTVAGDDARRLLGAFIASLHHQLPFQDARSGRAGDARAYEYTIATPDGLDLFSFVAAEDGTVTRVHAARGVFGDFEPAPELSSLIASEISRDAPPPAATNHTASSSHEQSRSTVVVVAVFGAGLLLALGIGARRAAASRRMRSAKPV